MLGLSWSIEYNVPLIIDVEKAQWKPRREVWLAGLWERKVFSDVVNEVFNVKIDFTNRHLVFHRVPSWEKNVYYAVEVFGEGARLGLIYYNASNQWSISPSGALASILDSMGLESVEINTSIKYVKGKKIEIDKSRCIEGKEYILVALRNHIGIARVLDPVECIVKVKDTAPRGFKLLGTPDTSKLVELNKSVIEKYAGEAKRFIERVYEKYIGSGKIHVSFSGGADSTSVLVLAVEALGAERVVAVYSDTGLEYPETREYVEKLASKLGVELVVLKPEVSFIDEIARRGLMSVENRWCTELLKLRPLREYYTRRNVKIYLDGARDYESTLRAKTPRISENPALPGVLRALPIKKWPRILVQLYLLSRGIELNPLYDKGYSRIGCIVCPAMHKHELLLSYNQYSEIHEEILKKTGLSREEYFSMKWTNRKLFTE